MIIVNLTGGLGNQMFQYALGRHLALKNNVDLKYHFTNALFNTQRKFELGVFSIKASRASKQELKNLGVFQNRIINRIFYLIDERIGLNINDKIITDRHPDKFNPSIFSFKDNIYLQGYWAHEEYFKSITNILRRDFTFRNKIDDKNKQIINFMKKSNSVSIHVRRSDYISNKRNRLKFVGLEYYSKSIKRISKIANDPVFFVFSDDIAWCKENFKFLDRAYFIDHNLGKESHKDMQLMSECKYNIIANSTFSWWAAWLNKNENKIVIKP